MIADNPKVAFFAALFASRTDVYATPVGELPDRPDGVVASRARRLA